MPEGRLEHLPFPIEVSGNAVLHGGGTPDGRVTKNRQHRKRHSGSLKKSLGTLVSNARQQQRERKKANLPEISSGTGFMLQIPDEDDEMLEFIAEKLRLEIVAEYEKGYLIVATENLDLQRVIELADEFGQAGYGSGKMAKILEIDDDPHSTSRLQRILEPKLFERWPFDDAVELILDVSIEVAAFGRPSKPRITRRTKPERKRDLEAKYQQELQDFHVQWDEKRMDREDELGRIVEHYNGRILANTDDGTIEFSDSFTMRIKMSGRGFKDVILNYPNLFEATLPDEVDWETPDTVASAEPPENFRLLPPNKGSPTICVVDSGIQEMHRWLANAIDREVSRCFLPGRPLDEVADFVTSGGHGTRVAGACLYGAEIPAQGTIRASFFLLNARVLDASNQLPTGAQPAGLLQAVIEFYRNTREARIFQHSIASNVPFRSSRMSVWATTIDLLTHVHDVLIIQAAGNLSARSGREWNPGIIEHLRAGRPYPDYLTEAASRIANPAQSLQALTVGSISDASFTDAFRRSISSGANPSSFSRTGYGMWESIKPEVVEYGGEYAVSDLSSPPALTTPPETCPLLTRSTLHGGPALAKDTVGTSFSAPKVAHLAGHLAAAFPGQSSLLYRALIVHAARWPDWAEALDAGERVPMIKSIGYGLPDLDRATGNTDYRATLITSVTYEIRAGQGLIFAVPIPAELRRQGESHDVRIDVTLSYSAEPRRTRKSRRGYLSVWLDWKSSKRREDFAAFRDRVLKNQDSVEQFDRGGLKWTLGGQANRNGETNGACRSFGTVQKDWTIIPNYELPDRFGIVVRGHKGWAHFRPEATARFSLVVGFESVGNRVAIYEPIKVAVETEIQSQQEVRSGVSVLGSP